MPDELPVQAPRARPVADLPSSALLTRAGELARRWAVALILARPLEGIGEVPLEDLAREAPRLCAQVLRAVESDVELERLTGRGAPSGREDSAAARRLVDICGARDPAAMVEAVEALRGVLWNALLDQLSEPSARALGDVGDRLACVCAAMLAAAMDALASPIVASSRDAQYAVAEPETAARERPWRSPPARQAVIVDERAEVSPAAEAGERERSWQEPAPAFSCAPERRLPLEQSPLRSAGAPTVDIEIRDERREEGPAAWTRSISAQLERFERHNTRFAVLLVEFVDLERLRREECRGDLSRLSGALEQALAAELGSWSGSLTRERPGRVWLLAPDTDQAGAERLAARLMRAAGSRASHRGAPLAVAIGAAVCPEDGREAAALAAHADLGLYAARSAARASGACSAAPAEETASERPSPG